MDSIRLFFCSFSGEDDFIIRNCTTRIQLRFAFIGVFVQLIFAMCVASAALFMTHIFDGSRLISIPSGLIWAFIVTNLYLLMLYTISPTLLPVARKRKITLSGRIKKVLIEGGKRKLLNFSFIYRVGLILFLAIIIAQPINVWLFAPSYEMADRFAFSIRTILNTQPLSWLVTFIVCVIMLLPIYFKYTVRTLSKNTFKDDFQDKTSEHLMYLRDQIGNPQNFDFLSNLIRTTDIKSIRTSDFYFQKTLIEYKIILEEYENFRKKYKYILLEKEKEYNSKCLDNIVPHLQKLSKISSERSNYFYNQIKKDLIEEIHEKFEYWADPPFRTKYKPLPNIATEAELLKSFYNQPD